MFLVIALSFYSCFPPEEQNFSVLNFVKEKPHSIIDSTGLKFNFDLQVGNWFGNITSYGIIPVLYDKNSELIFKSPDTIIIKTNGTKEKWDSIYTNFQIIIPYDEIKLDTGIHNVSLQLIAFRKHQLRRKKQWNLGSIYKKEIQIKIPQLFDQSLQEITIRNTEVVDKNLKLNFNIDYDFKFSTSQTKGVMRDESKRSYKIKAVLIDKNTKKEIPVIESYIDLSCFINADISKNQSCKMSIPYRHLKIKPGKYNLQVDFFMFDSLGKNKRKIYSLDHKFNLPQLYETKINLNNIKVDYDTYDTKSSLGRLFSKSSKNKGKGYPDVFVSVLVNGYPEYRSTVHDNTYEIASETAIIYIVDQSKLKVELWDYDGIGKNDKIGGLFIVNPKGKWLKELNAKRFGNAESNFIIEKKLYTPWNE